MRKLVRIEKIDKLIEITGAQRIEIAQILGWQVIVKKGEFKENDLCVFFEIDSFLPNIPIYEFLGKTKTYLGKEGYRLKTMKMKGVISQGLALPLSLFEKDRSWNDSSPFFMGDEVTELLNVIKYDVSLTSGSKTNNFKPGQTEGKFPSFLRKTDQERIQNLTSYFEIHKDTKFEETLKLDGSSCTMFKVKIELPWYKQAYNYLNKNALILPNFDTSRFGVCSRNLELKQSDNFNMTFDNNGKKSEYKQSDFWAIALRHKLQNYLPVGYAIQGELCGPKIQSNHEKLEENEFFLFDVFSIESQEYLTPKELRLFCKKYLPKTLQYVPTINESIRLFENNTLEDLLKRVEGESMNDGTISEGRVYSSVNNPEISFKVISNKYLIKLEK